MTARALFPARLWRSASQMDHDRETIAHVARLRAPHGLTLAQTRAIAHRDAALAMLAEAASDLPADDLETALAALVADRPDLTPDQIDRMGNRLCQIAHQRARAQGAARLAEGMPE